MAIQSESLLNPKLIDERTGDFVKGDLCIDGNQSISANLVTNPNSSTAPGDVYKLGISFVTSDQVLSDFQSTNRSISDERIEKRVAENMGPYDAVLGADFVRVQVK